MAHFIFYAGRAYKYKVNGVKNPVAKAIHDGYRQETTDILFAPYSAYSYEDLPSDKFGAEFGAIFFDPNSKQTLGEQIESYLNNVLKATFPQNAPNYEMIPDFDSKSSPTRRNITPKPIYSNYQL